MCSWARIGLPAATRPTSGSESCARLGSGRLNCLPRASLSARNVSDCRRMPRDVPPTSSITPLRASACRCSSAALAERKPSSLAISARVGGAPVRSIALCTRSRICCWRSVSLGIPAWRTSGWRSRDWLNIHPVLYFHPVLDQNAKRSPHPRRPRHRRHDRRHARRAPTTTSATARRAGRRRAARWPLVPPRRAAVESEQVAQLDSKDMDFATWQRARRSASPHTSRGPRSPASSSPTAPTRWRRRRTSCSACSRRPSRWC